MSLLQDLVTMIQRPLAGNDADWYQFVLDHVPSLRKSSKIITVTPDLLGQVEYNIPRLLRSQSISTDLEWIVYLLNSFSSDLGFTTDQGKSMTIYVPTQSAVEDLYSDYQTSKQVTQDTAS